MGSHKNKYICMSEMDGEASTSIQCFMFDNEHDKRRVLLACLRLSMECVRCQHQNWNLDPCLD